MSEIAVMAKAILPEVQRGAKERSDRARRRLKISGAVESLDLIAAKFDISGRSLRKIMELCAAADAEPEKYEHLRNQMNRTGKVHAAYVEMKRLRSCSMSNEGMRPE